MKLPNLASKYDLPLLFNLLGYRGHGAEIGVQRGVHALHLRQHWGAGTLHLIDAWERRDGYDDLANVSQEQQEENFQHVQLVFQERADVRILRARSLNAAQHFSDDFFNWIFLDAEHSYEAVSADLEAWTPKVHDGGVIAGHDYYNGRFFGAEFGVKRAVDEWANKNGYAVRIAADEFCPSWFVLKW